MLFLSFSNTWSLCFFFNISYLIIFFSFLIYLLPLANSTALLSNSLNNIKNNFYLVSGLECTSFFIVPVIFIFILNSIWSSNDITSWFGHLIYSSFQSKILYVTIIFFTLVLYILLSVSYFSSNEIYDFFVVKINFLYWLIFLFFSNSFFVIIFTIEVLSTLIFLLISTSVFSSFFFYKNINLDSKLFLYNTFPITFFQSLIFFFWVSLLSSLNLFLFIIVMYTNLVTFDWFLIEHLFYYLTLIDIKKDVYKIGLSWFIIIFSLFLKCGIAPFFLWKPVFFKGLNFATLLFYIVFYYFLLFLFFINFLVVYSHELFFYFSIINVFLVMFGLFILLFIICESFYIKVFFAISSILNSLLVILSMMSTHLIDVFFFL